MLDAWSSRLTDGGSAESIGAGAMGDPGAREVSDRMTALVAELQHRTRNLMAVVQALANETALSSGSIDEFSRKFSARLGALSRVQSLLSRVDQGEKVSFGDLVGDELSALGARGDRVTLEGPAKVRLRSSAVQTLALAIHELAANAVRHGALSQDAGRLAVAWRLGPPAGDGCRTLRVEWTERGVDMPAAGVMPTGFGRELIEQALPFQLGAKTSYDVTPEGVRCVIVLPTSERAM